MASSTIEVGFKQSGEHFSVPVSATIIIKDIIKYICEHSVISGKIDYNNYYLVLLNNECTLDDDRVFEEIRPRRIENPDYQLCMKTPKRVDMVTLLREYLRTGLVRTAAEPQTRYDDADSSIEMETNKNSMPSTIDDAPANQLDTETKPTSVPCQNTSALLQSDSLNEVPHTTVLHITQSQQFCGTSSENDNESKHSSSTNLELNMNSQRAVASLYVHSTQQEPTFSSREAAPNDNTSHSSRPEKLASTYQHFTEKVVEISAKETRDPIARRNISEAFNEINILLCGAPRVGKSTLINAICEKQLAETSAGLNTCTTKTSPYFLKGTTEIDSGTINYRYNLWDTPGIETWTSEQIRETLEVIRQKPKSDILSMIYCASPGSFASLEQLGRLLKECMDQHIFCVLVCTNKWGGSDEQFDGVMNDFQRLLESCHSKTREEHGVHFFGNIGLCTAVNTERFVNKNFNIISEPSGIDEIILGIMDSLDDEKLAQWCALALENKKFWKNFHNFQGHAKTAFKKLLGKK